MESTVLMGYASGTGAGNTGCKDGPVYLAKHNLVKHIELLYEKNEKESISELTKIEKISELCTRLAERTQHCVRHHRLFGVVGGDHSSAMGTWSGAASAIKNEGDLGLIWIDAHLDSHTPDTTPSGNIHGMPVAVLLGFGDERLTALLESQPKIKPENICIIGPRSYESGEWELIKKLNIKVFYMPEVKTRGFKSIFQEAKSLVTKNTVRYGISMDLDSLDPEEAPGVGSPEKNGISSREVCETLEQHAKENDPQFCGIEIAEFNPHLDVSHQTENIILTLLNSYGFK